MRSLITPLGAILVGGKSRRFGSNKALSKLGGRPLVEHVVESLRPVCDPIILIAKEKAPFLPLDLPVVPDAYDTPGPIAGLATALKMNRSERVVAASCDLPFIRPDLVRFLLSLSDGYDAVVPYYPDRYQPLCAVYGPECLPVLLEIMESGKPTLQRLVRRLKTRRVSPEELDEIRKLVERKREV